MEELKEVSINDILSSIENSKKIKEDLELSIPFLENELNLYKTELTKTKKFNLSYCVDSQNREVMHNV